MTMSFKQYIKKRRVEDTPSGDFIMDAKADKKFPDAKSWGEVKSYLVGIGAIPEAVAAGRTCWNDWLAKTGQPPLPLEDEEGESSAERTPAQRREEARLAGLDEFAKEQATIRERVAKMAMTDVNPMWALAWAVLQVEAEIEDVGNQLYAIAETLREKG